MYTGFRFPSGKRNLLLGNFFAIPNRNGEEKNV